MTQEQAEFEEWAILELLGHVRLAGKVSEQPMFGTNLGRIDIPKRDGGFTTQYFGGSSVYRLTPCSEDVARMVALHNEPEPVHRWELPAPSKVEIVEDEDDEGERDICVHCGGELMQDYCPECGAKRGGLNSKL